MGDKKEITIETVTITGDDVLILMPYRPKGDMVKAVQVGEGLSIGTINGAQVSEDKDYLVYDIKGGEFSFVSEEDFEDLYEEYEDYK